MVKRALDALAAASLLLLLFPLFLIIAILIKLDSRGPVFFRQERVGLNGRLFKVIKFRTMIDNAEKLGSGIMTDKEDPRITRVGRYLRKASIDEIPQLINVLRGEMSLVGPRPAPVGHYARFSESDKKRLAVRPGITGWAQVNGRNNLTWPERIQKDIWYVENYSLLLDLKIMLRTLKCVVLSEGVYSGRYRDEVRRLNRALMK